LQKREKAVKLHLLLLAGCLVLTSTLAMTAGEPAGFQSRVPGFPVQPALDCGAEPCDAVHRGARAFVDRQLNGLAANGRACADCHMPTDHFQLSPANVEARFQLRQERRLKHPEADDPLFQPIDADDFRTNGESASDFSNLRENGLVRISFQLPDNIKLIDPATNAPSSETFVDVWRMVPTVNDVKLTGPDGVTVNPWARDPNRTGGYQLDARVTTLQDQAVGALTNHAGIQIAPPQRLLDDLASFQRVLFTNDRVRALSDAVSAGTTPLPDPDPPLDELEQQGKVVFNRACAQCHGGPGQSTAQAPVIRFHDIGSQCPRPVDTATPARFAFLPCPPRLARNARTYEITLSLGSLPTPCPPPAGRVTPCVASGFLKAGDKIRRTSSDPGRAFQIGFVGGPAPTDDWNKFDVPGLRGISQTAPYFHNNSAATLEEVIDHYIEFFKRVRANQVTPPPIATTDGVHFDRAPVDIPCGPGIERCEERAKLLAYLRKL
jgi:cytochrome c peroxidase